MRALPLVPLVLAAATAHAAPITVTHQGRLLDATDRPVNEVSVPMVFKLFNSRLVGDSAERLVWQSRTCNVEVSVGHYATVLGEACNGEEALDDAHLPPGELRFLEITVGGTRLTPRLALTSAPTATVALRSLDTEALTKRLALAGTLNAAGNPVDWSQLKNVPTEFADGTDDSETYTAKEGGGLALAGNAFELASDPASLAKVSGGRAFVNGAGALELTAPTITTPSITGGTIAGATLTTPTISAGTLTGTAISGGTISGATMTGGSLSGATITGGTLSGVTLENPSITGGLRLGMQTECTASTPGLLRYNTNPTRVEVCAGGVWSPVGGADRTPDGLTFAPLTNQTAATVTSAEVTLAGFEGELLATVLVEGKARLQVNGGAWVQAARVRVGDRLKLRSEFDNQMTNLVTLVIGDTIATWSVGWLADPPSCKALLDAGTTSNGTYTIDLDGWGGNAPISVYCDMNAGGWTYASLNTPFRLNYTGAVQTITTANATANYRFTLYGAQGGAGVNSTHGGLGGKAVGSREFGAKSTLHVYVGGRGTTAGPADTGDCSTRTGGFNGGGRGSQGGSGGGGATDVRLALNDLSTRLLVAGGGGGCGFNNCDYVGGAGGGLTGSGGSGSGSASGGTQTAGGTASSGQSICTGTQASGGSNYQCNDEGGGGGGWWGGAAGGTSNTSGAGGSSYYGGMTADKDTTAGANAGNGYAEYIFR